MLIDKYRVREFFGTRHKWADLEVIIVSSQQVGYKKPPQLLLFQVQGGSKRPKDVLQNAIELSKSLKPTMVADFRQELPTELGNILSSHLIELQKTYLTPQETLVEDAARRYLDLVSWGEANSAKVLAEAEGISIRTMHSRLMNARKKGFLESPGSGFRFLTGV
jgi:hypothetical protein